MHTGDPVSIAKEAFMHMPTSLQHALNVDACYVNKHVSVTCLKADNHSMSLDDYRHDCTGITIILHITKSRFQRCFLFSVRYSQRRITLCLEPSSTICSCVNLLFDYLDDILIFKIMGKSTPVIHKGASNAASIAQL